MIDRQKYEQACGDYDKRWRLRDKALYRLCEEYPGHTAMDSVYAKLWIIGRTYSTGLERQVATTGEQSNSLVQVADHLLAHGDQIDDWLAKLRLIHEPLDPIKLRIIVDVHGRFVQLLKPITREKNQSARSFASKYLHFHNSVVPIYDSLAVKKLQDLIRWSDDLVIFEMPDQAEEKYARFVMQLFQLYQQMIDKVRILNVKYLDNYLLSLIGSDDRRTKKVGIAHPTKITPQR